jgi:crossover junction endodeoxyribonuclease RuvC
MRRTRTKTFFESSRFFIGVDPGQTGAAAMLPSDGLQFTLWDYGDWSLIQQLKMLLDGGAEITAAVERQMALPAQGRSSTLKIGRNWGMWEGVFLGLYIPQEPVAPQTWRKAMLAREKRGNDPKAVSLEMARRRYPAMAEMLRHKKDHNRAEAMLICEWLRRKMMGGCSISSR